MSAGTPRRFGALRAAAALLSPLAPPSADLGPDSLGWFPVVGAALGVGSGLGWQALSLGLPAPLAAGGAVVADLALSGMLHVDGLLDSADGLLAPHQSREQRLQILRDHHVGAFGVAAGVVGIGLRWAALANQPPSVLRLAGIGALSRSLMAAAVLAMPYARAGGGIASGLQGPPRRATELAVLGGIVSGSVLVALADPERKRSGRLVAGPVALVAGWAVLALARRRLGGYTGDVLGAAGWVAETAGLTAATWR